MTVDTTAAMHRVLAFVNTRDLDEGTDEWDSPSALAAWLAAHELAQAPLEATDADLQTARSLREGIRRALLAHDAHDTRAGEPPDGADPDGAEPVAAVPLHLQIDAHGQVVLAPAGGGVAGALAQLVAAIPAAAADGTWMRMKACPRDDCQWAFLDKSRNRSRRWCSMEVCGNREKTEAFRDRQRGSD